jgi:hypothetical protein
MTLLPNRISAYGHLSRERELALARQFLEIQSEAELDHFLPLLLPAIKLAAPLLSKVAGPLLKSVAGSIFSGGSSRKSRPRDGEEMFLGKIAKGLFREAEAEGEDRFLGGIIKGILGGELEAEHDRFLGGIIGKLFGGRELELEFESEREAESENYVQEQFIGGLLGKVFGGRELEAENEQQELGIARGFVRLATTASERAAQEIVSRVRAGRPPTEAQARKLVLRALVLAARQIAPPLADALASANGSSNAAGNGAGSRALGQGVHEEQTVLELMIGSGGPSGLAVARAGAQVGNGAQRGQASWVRDGNRLIFTLP